MKATAMIVLVWLLFSARVNVAHQATGLTLEDDGTIVGLPAEFGPANLRITFSQKSDDPPIQSIVLTLGKKSTSLPICVTGLLLSLDMKEIRISASWYHDKSSFPFYLQVELYDPGYDVKQWANPSYTLLFNLRTGKLMQMEVNIVRHNGKTLQHIPIDLANRCGLKELNTFYAAIYPKESR